MLESQQLTEGLNNEYLLQKKIEVMLDLQYKRIKADLDAIKASVEQLAQEMQGLKSAARKENYSAEQYTAQHAQFQQPQFQPSLQQPPSQYQPQFQQAQSNQQQQFPPPQAQPAQFQQPPQQQSAQQPTGTGSKAQQQFQQGLTSDDVSIEKFFSFGGKKR